MCETTAAGHPRARSVLHRLLARQAWRADPGVRLFYYPDDDALVAELIDGPVVTEELVHEGLLVRFDGADERALPISFVLTDFRGEPDSDAAREAQELLGPQLWQQALDLDREHSSVSADLDTAAALGRDIAWSLAARRMLPTRAIGFELRPGLLRAVVVDSSGVRLGQDEVELPAMDVDSVVRATGGLATSLRRRYARDLARRRFVVGFQLGGPVRTAEGVVEYFRKPRDPDAEDDAWPPDVNLAELLAQRIQAQVWVFNDVSAFAALERWHGQHGAHSLYAVLVVRRGMGGVLVRDGQVDERLVMEVGNLTVDTATMGEHPESIEAHAAEPAIVRNTGSLTGRPVHTVEEAARLVDEPLVGEKAAFAFFDAGRTMAKALAAVQAVVRPDHYVVYVASAVADHGRAAARAYRTGVDEVRRLVTYEPLRKPDVVIRPIVRDEGARGAALIALERAGVARPDGG